MDKRGSFPGINPLRCAVHSSLFSAGVKNAWSSTSILPYAAMSCRGASFKGISWRVWLHGLVSHYTLHIKTVRTKNDFSSFSDIFLVNLHASLRPKFIRWRYKERQNRDCSAQSANILQFFFLGFKIKFVTKYLDLWLTKQRFRSKSWDL